MSKFENYMYMESSMFYFPTFSPAFLQNMLYILKLNTYLIGALTRKALVFIFVKCAYLKSINYVFHVFPFMFQGGINDVFLFGKWFTVDVEGIM